MSCSDSLQLHKKRKVPTTLWLRIDSYTIFQANYAYRSIAEFVKHVTDHDEEHLERNPFPELHRPCSDLSESDEHGTKRSKRSVFKKKSKKDIKKNASSEAFNSNGQGVKLYKAEVETLAHAIQKDTSSDEDIKDTISPETGTVS